QRGSSPRSPATSAVNGRTVPQTSLNACLILNACSITGVKAPRSLHRGSAIQRVQSHSVGVGQFSGPSTIRRARHDSAGPARFGGSITVRLAPHDSAGDGCWFLLAPYDFAGDDGLFFAEKQQYGPATS